MAVKTGPTIAERIRNAIKEIRRKPYPLSDLIPLMQQAADRIETLEQVRTLDDEGTRRRVEAIVQEVNALEQAFGECQSLRDKVNELGRWLMPIV